MWWIFGFLSSLAIAAPQSLEVWFLSAHKKAELEQIMRERTYRTGPLTAERECQPMGDYCFDPQYGLYQKEDEGQDISVEKIENKAGPSIPFARSVDRDLIVCESGNMFDIFCGKARKEAAMANTKLELWIDTSSSMREMDFTDKSGGCFRKSLVERLDKTCGFNQKVNVMMFDTSIKQAGNMESLCLNQGLNDHKRMIDWIERSNAKKLIIITDIYEFHKEFSDYVESKHGRFRGDKEPLVASQLLDMVDDLERMCR